MDDKFRYFDWVVAGMFALVPLLTIFWWCCWGRKARRPDLAAENAGATLVMVVLLLLVLLVVASVQQWFFWCLVGVNILGPILYLNRVSVTLAVLGLILTACWWRGRGKSSGRREEPVENVVMVWIFLGVTLLMVLVMMLTFHGFVRSFMRDFSPG